MEFKNMSDKMTEAEINIILKIAFPCSKLAGYERYGDSIRIYYLNPYERGVPHKADFLPDDIYIYNDDGETNDIPLDDCNAMYEYRKFMIARGYSEYWQNNPYIKEK